MALAFNPVHRSARSFDAVALHPMSIADWCLLITAIVALLATLVLRDQVFRETARYSLQGLALMPIFYFSIRHATRFPFALLDLRLPAKLGVYSYAIYLIHYVAIKALEVNAPWLASKRPMLLLTALAISIAYAAVIDQLIDPYFRALRRRFRTQLPQV